MLYTNLILIFYFYVIANVAGSHNIDLINMKLNLNTSEKIKAGIHKRNNYQNIQKSVKNENLTYG